MEGAGLFTYTCEYVYVLLSCHFSRFLFFLRVRVRVRVRVSLALFYHPFYPLPQFQLLSFYLCQCLCAVAVCVCVGERCGHSAGNGGGELLDDFFSHATATR